MWRTAFPGGSGIGDCPLASDGVRLYGTYWLPIAPASYVKAGLRSRQRAFALDLDSGRKLWDVALGVGVVPKRNQAAIPLYDRSRVFIGSAGLASMHALDAATGSVVWKRQVGGTVKSSAVAADGILYFADSGGTLWAVREGDGTTIGARRFDTRFNVGSPIILGPTLVLGSATGRVVALPRERMAGSRRLAATPLPVALRKWFERFGAAGTGAVSWANVAAVLRPSDLERARERFLRLDRNGDGFISRAEARQHPTDVLALTRGADGV